MNPISALRTKEDRKIGRRIKFLAQHVLAETMDGNELIEAVANARHVYAAMLGSDVETIDMAIADAGAKGTPAVLARMIAGTLLGGGENGKARDQRLRDAEEKRVASARARLGSCTTADQSIASLLDACARSREADVPYFCVDGWFISVACVRKVCQGLRRLDDVSWSIEDGDLVFCWERGKIRLRRQHPVARKAFVYLVQRTAPGAAAKPTRKASQAAKPRTQPAARSASQPASVARQPQRRPAPQPPAKPTRHAPAAQRTRCARVEHVCAHDCPRCIELRDTNNAVERVFSRLPPDAPPVDPLTAPIANRPRPRLELVVNNG